MKIVREFLFYLSLFPILIVSKPMLYYNGNINSTTSIYDFWKEQDKYFKLGKQKDIVLFLGNTGSGKSTTALFITDTNLTAVETFEGSEEFGIIDADGKIGNETLKSHTLIPELIIDQKSGSAYYDCPGFLDTRSAAHDITIAYFLNKLMTISDSFKLVFCVSHSSVKRGENRVDFANLIKNAVKLIKDIEKYSDGIALIVTKVEASVSDEAVINRIANFLEEVLRTLNADSNKSDQSQEEKKVNSESIKFIETLLKKNENSYERVGLFRRADKAGPLDNNPTLQSEKSKLQMIINQNIKYIRKDSDDFGFIISPESATQVVELIDEIIKTDFVGDVSNVCKEIEEYFVGLEKRSTDIDNLHEKLQLANQMLTDVRVEEPINFLKQILNVTYQLHVGLSIETIEPIVKHIEYVDFLSNVSNKSLTNPLQLANELSETVSYLQNAQKWYRFLIDLHRLLSKNHFQNNDMKKVANEIVAVSNIIGEKDRKNVSDIGLKRLLDHAQNTIFADVEAMQINSYQVKALKNVLTEYSNDHSLITCESNQLNMTVKGRVIKMSDVIKHKCYSTANYIEIFALNTMIIDENIDKNGKRAQILIIAPIWDISGSRNILLNGEKGKNHTNAVAKNGIGGDGFPGDGGHGLPGVPGGSGGSFLALGNEFINGQDLTIQMNGGDGGPAQHGGNGTKGLEGKDPPTISQSNCWIDEKKMWDDAAFDWTCEKTWIGTGYLYAYVVLGKNGTKAGDAGNGGRQGYGGNAGNVLVFELGEGSKYTTQTIKGNVGSIGKKGFSGGGETQNGKTYHIEKQLSQAGSWSPQKCFVDITKTIEYGKNEAGKEGTDNTTDRDLLKPDPILNFYHLSFTLNRYKSYVREHLADSTRETELRKFLNKMTNDKRIKFQYDTLGLVNELQTLENQYFLLRNKLSFIPLLESLLDRISEFARVNATTPIEHKKVLSYLYTAALSKIYGIKNKVNQNTVFDLDKFLEVVEGNIGELQESVVENNINIVRNEYKSSLDEKVRSANEFIDTQITPEIDNIFRTIDDKITSLINESIQKQNETAEAIKEQKKRRRELEKQIQLRRALGPLKMIASAASFFGPVGAAAGAAIGGITMLTEALFLDENSAKGNDKIGSLVSADFKTSMSRMNEVLKQKPELIKQKINDLDKFIKENLKEGDSTNVGVSDAEISAIKDKITKYKDKIDELKAGGDVPEHLMVEFNNVEKELKELSTDAKTKLEKRKSELSEKEAETKKNIEKQLRVVTYVQAVVNLADISVQFYNQIRNDEAKLKLVGDVIVGLGNDLQALKVHEGKIYNILIPQIRTIEDTVNNISKSLAGNSHVELDIKKWNIRSTLSEVRLVFNQMTNDFKVHDALELSLKKLDEGMATLIDVYDRIDSYADNAKLAAYIANIGSKKASEIVLSDVELSDAVTSLQKIIRSNLVLEEFEMAMHAFKQHYFPFAQLFLKNFELPEHLRMDDTSSLIQKSVEQITDLKKKIKASKSLFNEYDASMHSNIYFDGGIGSMPPFYIWKNHEIKNEIKKLFKGEEITIKAEVENGVNQNAIKFNDINIRIKLSDTRLQTELDAELRHFSVNMTMIGNNYYGCNNRYYSISLDRNLLIKITFEKNADGSPKDPNGIWRKINENDPFLSPYAMWTIQLSGDLSKLKKFNDENIDLELIGRGQYLEHGTFIYGICNDHLDKYYNIDETISNADAVIFS